MVLAKSILKKCEYIYIAKGVIHDTLKREMESLWDNTL